MRKLEYMEQIAIRSYLKKKLTRACLKNRNHRLIRKETASAA